MIRFISFIIIGLLVTSCKPSKSNEQSTNATNADKKTIPTSGEFNYDDIVFQYQYDQENDKTELTVIGKSTETYAYDGYITKHVFSDLDADEKDEAIIMMTAKNEKSSVKVFTLTEGYPNEVYMKSVADPPGNISKKYTIQYGQLIEKITVNIPGTKSITNEARYNLVAAENGHQLLPQGWTREQLKTKRGQFKTGIYGSKKYYNKMYINESETGEWIVDIKVKDSKTERNICEFQAVGEFINKDLYVPLNYANDNLDGVLQIRYVGKTAIVYTQDKNNATQMAKYCKEKGNLAGNYTKLKVMYE